MRTRDLSLDIIRVLACVMVVFMHSPMPSENANGPFLVALSYFTAPCIGLFFMVSGALLLPVKTDYFTFIRRRLSKIVVPTLVWTAIYLALHIYFSESEINILQSVLSVPFSAQGNGVLWFMYTLTGLYLLAPILSSWLEKANVREIEFVLLLWAVTLCYPLIENFLIVTKGTTGVLYYFTGYAGYFLLGYYLKHYPSRLCIFLPGALASVGVVLLIALKYYRIEFDFYSLFWYESIFVVAMCTVVWIIVNKMVDDSKLLVKNVGGGIYVIIKELSSVSFGVYLTHILIMRHWLWHMKWIRGITCYPLQTFTVAVMTFMLSVMACSLLARIPLLNLMVGCRKRR